MNEAISLAWAALALPIFLLLLKVKAPFGRHTVTTWGPTVSGRIGWFLMESPSLLIMVAFLAVSLAAPGTGSRDQAISPWSPTLLAFGLWILHYLNRSVVFPLRMDPSASRMPVVIAVLAFVFNLINASLNGHALHMEAHDPAVTWTPRVLAGLGLFLLGEAINVSSDRTLLKLRRAHPGTYVIPRGGLFRWISCPNLAGEILAWIGFAVLVGNPAALSFAAWTFANLAPRARDHHRWYLERFPEYPKERKALVPFLW